ncbi:MAG: glycosidase, partial [Myxococcota bacterium]
VLGRVPINRIDGIFFENRGDRTGAAAEAVDGFDLGNLERVKLYRASFDWKTKYFDMEGFYRTGHYHWAYEGDFFGILPEANYGPFPDIYNADVPIGVAVTGKKAFEGLKVMVGPQIWWGANPAIVAKYSRARGRWRFDVVHHEDIAPPPTGGVAQSQAVPEQLTRRTGVHLGFERGDQFTFDLGGLFAGTPKLGQRFTYQVDAAGNESYLDSGFDVINDEIRLIDTLGAKARITGRIGKLKGFVQGAYQGLVADGGGDYGVTVAGWRLRASGRGNNTNALAGAALQLGNLVIAPMGMWQRPLIGPNVPLAEDFDPITRAFRPAVRSRNFIDDPFAVLENREQIAGELLIAWDPTPITWFFQWDNEAREDAGFAGSLSLVYRNLLTTRDSTFGFLEDGTLFSFGGAAPPAELWDVNARVVNNVGDVQLHWNAYAGTVQARGTDERIVTRGGGGLKAYWESMLFQGWVKFGDYGPYDFHQDFNLTFPFQTYVDISGGLSRMPLVGTSTRIGGFVKYRLLDEFSPDLAIGPAGTNRQLLPGEPLANEFEIGTYVRLSL